MKFLYSEVRKMTEYNEKVELAVKMIDTEMSDIQSLLKE